MTLAQVKEELTYAEFLDWIEYYRRDERRRTKGDYYSAGIRLELVRLIRLMRRAWFKGDQPTKEPELEAFLLEYSDDVSPTTLAKRKKGYRPKDGQAYTSASKAAWMGRLGLFG